MKLTKTVKYNYKLNEENLEKDIDKFIFEAKKGNYRRDRHYNSEGLRIIKQYFRILQDKFDNQEFGESKICYEKLIIFCFDASAKNNLFDYEDLLAKISSDFDKFIRNYFICLIKTCNTEELAERVSKYASHLDVYGFDSDKEILLENLNELEFKNLEARMLIKTEGMTKKDQDKQDIIHFLMEISEIQEDKEKYLQLCERFRRILNNKEFEFLRGEYEENRLLGNKIDNALDELKQNSKKESR